MSCNHKFNTQWQDILGSELVQCVDCRKCLKTFMGVGGVPGYPDKIREVSKPLRPALVNY